MNKFLFLALGAAVFFALLYFTNRKNKNFLTTCLIMMCYTWQSSWINIFGQPTSELQLPWFYVIGVLMLFYLVFNIRKCFMKTYNGFILAVFAVQIIWITYPLLITERMNEGIKNYIMTAFFVILVLICYLYHEEAGDDNYENFRNALIWSVFLSALGVIVQYVAYKYASLTLFKIEILPSFSGYQLGCQLIMEDHSSATIMFGVAVFYLILKIGKKNWWYCGPALLCVVAAMAMTSRRTSTLSLVIMLAVFAMFHYKGLGKKIGFGVIILIVGGVILFFLLKTRPVDSLLQLLNDNGRFVNYSDSLNVIKVHPFGVGFDDLSLAGKYMEQSGIVPHNAFLRWICMGGWPLCIFMIIIIVSCLINAYRKNLMGALWGILYTVLASNFIPDILCARFFVIICGAAMLMPKYIPPKKEGASAEKHRRRAPARPERIKAE